MRALICLIVLTLAAGTSASRILALPLCGAPSHVFIMWKVCKELGDRGHDVKVRAGRYLCDLHTMCHTSNKSLLLHQPPYK